MLQAAIDTAQENVSGDVVIRLEKGNVIAVSRTAANSLYSEDIASFSGNNGYNQADAEGFIKLNALRLRLGV
jgi:argininosuccinate synthase